MSPKQETKPPIGIESRRALSDRWKKRNSHGGDDPEGDGVPLATARGMTEDRLISKLGW
jgi:hypothetical protein